MSSSVNVTYYSDPEYVNILKDLYIVLDTLMILSNLWLMIRIISDQKLRQQFFYGKVLMCASGDILVSICLPFTFIAYEQNFWKTNASCQIIIFYLDTYMTLTYLVLVSLLLHPIFTYVTIHRKLSKITATFLHIGSLVVPYVASIAIYLPIYTTYIYVTLDDDYGRFYCKIRSNHPFSYLYDQTRTYDFYRASYIFSMAVVVPAFICLLVFAFYQRYSVNHDQDNLELSLMPRSNEEGSFGQHAIFQESGESNNETEEKKDQSRRTMSILIMTGFSWLCSIPCLVYYISLYDKDPKWLDLYFKCSIYVYYIPTAVRPYFWLMNTDLRASVRRVFKTYRCSRSLRHHVRETNSTTSVNQPSCNND